MTIISVYIFIAGLCIGSFLNVCIDRIIKEESIIWPPSHCDHCGSKLSIIDLIPVISYIFLRGRCRKCQQKISIKYPFIELLNAFLYVGIYFKYSLSFEFIKYCIFISIMIVIGFIDLRTKNIYTRTSVFSLISSAILIIVGTKFFNEGFLTYMIGAFLSFIVFYVIVKATSAMGRGDIDAAVLCGLFLGVKYTILTILLSFIIGGIAGILLMCFKGKKRNEGIAFIPFLSLGSFIAVLYGDFLINWYLCF